MALGLLTTVSGTSGAIHLEVMPSYGTTYPRTEWIPLSITVRSTQTPFSGMLQVDSASTQYQLPVYLPAGSRQQFSVAVPTDPHSPHWDADHRIPVSVTVTDGQTTILQHEQTLVGGIATDPQVLVIDARGSGYDFLRLFDSTLSIFYSTSASLPSEWMSYQGLSAIVIDDEDVFRLSNLQVEALVSWVRLGGTLFISTASGNAGFRSSLVQELIDVRLGQEMVIDLGDSEPKGEFAHLFARTPMRVRKVASDNLHPLAVVDSIPLLLAATVGRGTVVVVPFEQRRYPLSDWPQKPQLYLQFFAESELEEPVQAVVLDHLSTPMLLSMPVAFIHRTTTAAWLGGFVLLVGLLSGVSRKIGQSRWLLAMTVLLVGAFGIASFLAVGRDQLDRSLTLSEIAVLRRPPHSHTSVVSSYVTLFSSQANSYEVTLPRSLGGIFNNPTSNRLTETLDVSLEHSHARVRIHPESLPHYGSLRSQYWLSVPIDVSLVRQEDAYTLHVSNQSALAVDDVFVNMGGRWWSFSGMGTKAQGTFSIDPQQRSTGRPWSVHHEMWQSYDWALQLQADVMDEIARAHGPQEKPYAVLRISGTPPALQITEVVADTRFQGYLVVPLRVDR